MSKIENIEVQVLSGGSIQYDFTQARSGSFQEYLTWELNHALTPAFAGEAQGRIQAAAPILMYS